MCFCSALWGLGEYCHEKQSSYQKMGIQGRWQVSPEDLEPPQKKIKSDICTADVIQKKVCTHW